MQAVWRIEMLGTLRMTRDDLTISRFRTRRVAILLAHLSFYLGRDKSREELGELLWPDQPDETIRRNLRQALFSLRQTLEPPPLPKGSVLMVKQAGIRIDSAHVQTDVQEFTNLVDQARKMGDSSEQESVLRKAVGMYRGELLPGFHDEWILRERLRLEDLHVSCLRRLIQLCKRDSQDEEAISYLHLALRYEPLQEDWHTELMTRYLRSGRPKSALKQFGELKELLKTHLGCEPSTESRALADRARREAGPTVPVKGKSLSTSALDSVPEVSPVQDVQEVQTIRLPLQVTRFYGRTPEIELVRAAFLERQGSIVTLLGPAGTGKTRLSVEVARSLAEQDGWNVWFVSLAELSKGSMILDAVVDAMRARRTGASNPYEQIRERASSGSNLLVLDNLEHILEEAIPVISDLMAEVPTLKLLITSRQTVRLSGEALIPLDPLPIPKSPGDLATTTREDLARIGEFPSIQLFIDRSQALRPDVQLTPTNARTIARICAKLEGVPLAIELAAGLSGAFSPGQMLRHLERRLTALASRRRDGSPRHRSLRAAIDYSFDSLGTDRQRLFSALSVFRGGFTIDSARHVCFAGEVPHQFEQGDEDERCLSLVLDLQERSLVQSDNSAEGLYPRFQMLESFRQYGEEQLSAEQLEDLKRRHAAYFLTRFSPPGANASSEERTQHHHRIESEYENFISAVDFLIQTDEFESSIRMLGTLTTTWLNRGPTLTERAFIRQLATIAETNKPDPTLHVQLLRMLGTTFIRSSEYNAAYEACQVALAVATEANDRHLIAICYSALSTCAGFAGRMQECLDMNLKVLELLTPEDEALLERTHLGIGAVLWGRGQVEEAEQEFLLARAHSERLRGGESDALILLNLARASLDLNRFDESMPLIGEAIRISQRLHDDYTLAQCLTMTARYHWLKGNLPAALATNFEALQKGRDVAFSFLTILGVRSHALILADTDSVEAATILLAATSPLAKMNRALDDIDFASALEKCRGGLAEDVFERAWAKGLAMSPDQALLQAMEYR